MFVPEPLKLAFITILPILLSLWTYYLVHGLIYTIISPVIALEPAEFLQYLHRHGVSDAQFEVFKGKIRVGCCLCSDLSMHGTAVVLAHQSGYSLSYRHSFSFFLFTSLTLQSR